MKISLCLIPLLLLVSCVTSQDIRDVADSVGRLELVAADTTKTTAEVRAQVVATKGEVELIAERVEERTEGFLEALTDPEQGGVAAVVTGVALFLLNQHRNRTRQHALGLDGKKATPA